jgi:hypothetical protein
MFQLPVGSPPLGSHLVITATPLCATPLEPCGCLHIPQARHVRLVDIKGLTSATLLALAEHCPHIESLDVSGCGESIR